MDFSINKNILLPMLQLVSGVIEKRQGSDLILTHFLLEVGEQELKLTASNAELEAEVSQPIISNAPLNITLPARKILDITRSLADDTTLNFSIREDKITVTSGKSRFSLSTLPATDFPKKQQINPLLSFSVPQQAFRDLLEHTQFAMAQHDVRYYLNGLLLDIHMDRMRAVATNGHRLSMDEMIFETPVTQAIKVIVPKKCIIELLRLLKEDKSMLTLTIDPQQICFSTDQISLTSQLIDGDYPDYNKVIPEKSEHILRANSETLRQGLSRAAILSNDKNKGVKLAFTTDTLRASAKNPEQEEAEEEIMVQYQGEALQIGFNVSYLLEALAAIKTEQVNFSIKDGQSSALIFATDDTSARHVIMPMRL